MLRLANIHSLSEFRHNTKDFVEKIKQAGEPIVLTVNGRPELVVYEASAFQEFLDEMAAAKEEIQQLKTELADTKMQMAKSIKRSA